MWKGSWVCIWCSGIGSILKIPSHLQLVGDLGLTLPLKQREAWPPKRPISLCSVWSPKRLQESMLLGFSSSHVTGNLLLWRRAVTWGDGEADGTPYPLFIHLSVFCPHHFLGNLLFLDPVFSPPSPSTLGCPPWISIFFIQCMNQVRWDFTSQKIDLTGKRNHSVRNRVIFNLPA